MYTYTHESGRGFFERVCALVEQTRISTDPPPPCHLWIASCLYCLCLSRFLPLTAVNVYSRLQYLVLGDKLQGGEIGHPPLLQGQAMQHPVCGVPSISLPGTPVNRLRRAPTAGGGCRLALSWWHSSHCHDHLRFANTGQNMHRQPLAFPQPRENPLGERSRWVMIKPLLRTTLEKSKGIQRRCCLSGRANRQATFRIWQL